MKIGISNEWAPLKRVMVGHGMSMGPAPSVETAYDPTSKHHLKAGTYPLPEKVEEQLDHLAKCLIQEGIEVIRPLNVPQLEQVFARDVGMVIDDILIRSRMIEERRAEWNGISPQLGDIPVLALPDKADLEGGDVVVLEGAIAVGVTRDPSLTALQTARTNQAGVDFLRSTFPQRDILAVELHKNDEDPAQCALHLDCAFMPLGGGEAIMCRDAFLSQGQFDALASRFSDIIDISTEEAALLQSNLLHVAPDVVLMDPRFKRLGEALRNRGYRLIDCPMDQVGKMGGLFRCTTLPLLRLS